MSAIATGVLAACLARRIERTPRRLAGLVTVFGIVGICAVLFAGRTVYALLQHSYGLLLSLSAACVVLGAHWLGASGFRVRGFAWLCSCGRLSYEMYLFHMFCVFGVLGIASASGLNRDYAFVWYVPATLATWLLGYAVARWYSQPIERRLRRHVEKDRDVGIAPITETL
jgi:peptidoglycan/LPS O-acetylase OafA/YrhL